jgi:hypothetical protein
MLPEAGCMIKSPRFLHGLRSISKAKCGKMLGALLNIVQPVTRFSVHNKTIGSAVADVK